MFACHTLSILNMKKHIVSCGWIISEFVPLLQIISINIRIHSVISLPSTFNEKKRKPEKQETNQERNNGSENDIFIYW